MPRRRRSAQLVSWASAALLVIFSLPALYGCSTVNGSSPVAEDMIYLTPVPQETLQAYRPGTPISDKLQAVIAARAGLDHPPHFKPSGVPSVVYVERMSLQDARKRVKQAGSSSDTNGLDTEVWLVVFEGDWQVTPPEPGHIITPPPPFHGCAYVIVKANGGSGIETGGVDCTS